MAVAVGVAVLQSELEPLAAHPEEDIDDRAGPSILTPHCPGRTTGPVLVNIQEPVMEVVGSVGGSVTESEIPRDPQTGTTEETTAETEQVAGAIETTIGGSEAHSEPTQEQSQATTAEQSSDRTPNISQAEDTITPPANPPSSPVQDERTECSEQLPESPVILITSKVAASSPTTGLVTGSILSQLFPLPPSP